MVTTHFLQRVVALLLLSFIFYVIPQSLYSQCAGGGTPIETADFEGAYTGTGGWAMDYVSSAGSCTMGSDNFGLVSSLSSINPISGNQFWGAQDVQGNCAVPVNSAAGETVTFTYTVPSLATYTEVEVCFWYTVLGFDLGDNFEISISTDGSVIENDQLVTGMNGGGVTVAWTQACYVIPIVPGQIVSLEILVIQNGGSDYAGIDDVSICEVGVPGCSITNVSVLSNGTCNGDDATYTVCADVSLGSGDYDLIDTDNGNAIISSLTGQADGNICFPVTVTGPTNLTTINVDVVDNANALCMGGTPQPVIIPECPVPCIEPPAPILTDIDVCNGDDTEIIIPPSAMVTENIFTESFEGADMYTVTIGAEFNDGINDHFGVTDGSNIGNISGPYSGADGINFWAAEDIDDTGATGASGISPQVVTFDAATITGYSNLTFCGLFAVGNDNGPGSSAYDEIDYILVEYNVDGAGWTNGLRFSYVDAGDAFNEPLAQDTNFDGNGDGDLLDTEFQNFSFSIPAGNSVQVQITVAMNGGNEEIAFDNIIIKGDIAALSNYNFYDADPAGGAANLLAGQVASYDPMTMTGDSPETIFVSCVNADGCEGPAAPVVITVNENPTPSVSDLNICTGELGLLDVGIFTSYLWSTNETTQTISVGAGTYEVTVTDANGCTGTTSVTVNEFAAPVPSLSDLTVCTGSTATLDPGTFTSYLWGNGETTPTITVGEGTYLVTVTDANGCTGTASATLTEGSMLSTSLMDEIVCPGFTTTLNPGTFSTYQWGGGETTQTITVGVGTYDVTVTDGGGCSGTGIATITAFTAPVPVLADVSVCPGGATTILDPGVFDSYIWGGGETSQTITVGAGTYMVTVTDVNGCTKIATANVTEFSEPMPSLSNLSVCPGETSTLDPGAFASYVWSSGETTQVITASAGTYMVTVTSADGCMGEASATITELPAPSLTPLTLCQGDTGSILFTGTPALSNPFISSDQTVATIDDLGLITALTEGTTTITFTDLNSCTSTAVVTVILLQGVPMTEDISYCLGSPSAAVTATPSSGGILTWYDMDPSLGGMPLVTAPIPATTVATVLNYWVTETTSCTGPAAMLTVTIRALSNATAIQTCVDASNYDLEVCFDAINPGPTDMFNLEIDGIDYGPFSYSANAGMTMNQYCVTISDLDPADMTSAIEVIVTDNDPTAAVITVVEDIILATTSFEEGTVGDQYVDTGDALMDHDLVNNIDESEVDFTGTTTEIGLDASYISTGSNGLTDGDFVGFSDFTGAVGAYSDGVQGYQMSDTDGVMVVTFDPVDISSCASVDLSIDHFVASTGWETDDAIIVSVDVDGTSIDILNTTGADINDLLLEGAWITASTIISGSTAILSFSLESNAGGEAVYFDNVIFSGTDCSTSTMAQEMCMTNTNYDEFACFVCPTIGSISNLTDICEGELFDVTASDILGVDMMTNLDVDYAIEFVSFSGTVAPVDPYLGGTLIGVVPFNALTGPAGGPYEAMLTGLNLTAGIYQICALLEPDPTIDPTCRPSQCTSIIISEIPEAPVIEDLNLCEGESTEIIIGGSVGELPFVETFDIANEGLGGTCSAGICDIDNPASNGQWIITGDNSEMVASSDFILTGGGSLNGQDVGAEICFETTMIDITGYTGVNFSIDVSESGDHETQDYVDVNYIVDGVSTTVNNWMGAGSTTHTLVGDLALGGALDDDDWGTTTVTTGGISGTSLVIQVCMINNAGSETISLDNLMVDGNANLYNFYDADPSTGNLLASGVASYDPMTTVANSPSTIFVSCINAAGCEGPAEMIMVTVNPAISATCTSTDVLCFGEDTGTAMVVVTGGTSYDYIWSNGETTSSLTGLIAGTYEVTVTDASGCTTVCSSVVSEPAELIAVCSSVDVVCNGDMDGSATVVVSGGSTAYSYLWSSGGTMANEENLGAGIYTVTVTDMNGCTVSCSTTIMEPTAIEAEISCGCGLNVAGTQIVPIVSLDGLIGGLPDMDGSSYTISSSDGTLSQTTATIGEMVTMELTDLAGGPYTITIVDDLGCELILDGVCDDCSFGEFSLIDPCICNGDQSENGAMDGTFSETVQVLGPTGYSLVVGVGSLGLIDIQIGDAIPEVSTGVYEIVFDHLDNDGYELYVELVTATGLTIPLLDINGNQIFGVNACQYPILSEPNVEPIDFCVSDESIDLSGATNEILGHPGTITATINGIAITNFDPATFGLGLHLIQWTFIGDFVSDQGGTQAAPAIPGGTGCGTSVFQQVTVHSGGQLNCNDHVNVSLDENCGLGPLSVDIFMEGAANDQFFGYRILGPLDVPIELENQNDPNYIGNYIGQTLNYEVFDVCTGNVCWGTITLEDKIVPEIACDCETPYLADGITPNPDCTFKCYEVWDLEILEIPGRNNELLPDVDDSTPEDNCFNFGDPAMVLSYSDGTNCGEQIVTRELAWTYIDELGQTQYLTCTQNFLFDNIELTSLGSTENGAWDGYPDIFSANSGDKAMLDIYTPEKEVYLDCGAETSPEAIAAAYDIDTPGRPTGVENDDHSSTPIIVEHNEGYPYAYPYVVQTGWAGRHHAKPIDNNICNIWTVYSDLTYDTCAEDCYGNSKIARSWTILDWCNAATIEFVQTIKRVDQEGPQVSGPDHIVSVDPWGCYATFEIPTPEHLLDNCDKNPTWSVVGPVGVEIMNGFVIDLPKGITTLNYVAEDCCGNVSYSPFTVTVEDRTAPTAIALQTLVVQLTNEQDGDGSAKLYAINVDNESHDGCGPVHFEIRRNGNDWCNPGSNTSYNNDGHEGDLDTDTDGGAYVIFCCEDAIEIDDNGVRYGIHDVILRVWDDGDMDGVFGSSGDNYNETWTKVRVEDKQAPVIVCPAHIELSCNEDFNDYDLTGRPYGFSTCGDIECDGEPSDNYRTKPANSPPFVGEEILAYNPSCRRGAIQRTWSCEGKTCTQWIIMRDTEDGDLEITWPEDQTSDCLGFEAGEPDIVERLCELTGTSLQSDTFYFEDGACYKILNHWSVINWCDYDADDTDLNDLVDLDDDGLIPGLYTHTQVLKLIDTEKPTLTIQDTCFAVNADCVGEGISIWASGADNGICASEWLKWEAEVDMNSDWVVDYTFSSWYAPDDPFYVAPTSGEGVHINLPDGLSNGCSSKHRVRWTVSDGCGNDTQGTSFFTIEDKKQPTPYMVNLSTALMEDGSVELWAKDFDAGSFDNCTPQDFLVYTFSSTVPYQLLDPSEEDPWYDADGAASQNDYNNGDAELWDAEQGTSAMVFTTEDFDAAQANGGTLDLPIYVWDLCGNVDFAIVNLKLVDNGGDASNIAGRVATESGVGVEGVKMSAMSEQIGYPTSTLTIEDGEYVFEYFPMYNDYTLEGEKNDDWLNGVTTLDLVLIQRHILGISELDSPYKLIAADASNDENVSAIDLIVLRKLILGIYDELPNNDSWRFTDADASMNVENPWPFSEFVNVLDLSADMNEDFIGVKVGDVNGSVELELLGESTDTRSSRALNLNVEEVELTNGITELRFSSNNFESIAGFQFTLEGSISEILEIKNGLLAVDESNIVNTKGSMVMSWNTDRLISLGEAVLFTVQVKKDLSSNLAITDYIAQSEAYQGESLEAINVVLESTMDYVNTLAQNEPNPWRSETTIGFTLSEAGKASLSVYDITGKVLFTEVADYTAGTHQAVIKGKQLGDATGVLYYKLESGEFASTKKMLFID